MEDPELSERAVGDILAAVHVIDIASETGSFEDWLEEEHATSVSDEILQGYKFFMETALRSFLNNIIYSAFPLISEDFVFHRARFDGVKLAKIPNTCEKTAFVKNVNDHRRRLRKAETLQEIHIVLDGFSEEILQPFNDLNEEYTTVDPNLEEERDDVLSTLAIFHTFVRFNDLQNGHPNGYYLSVLESDLREERMETALKGYIYTLQFVWENLVGDNQYEETSLSDMHQSEKWYQTVELGEELPDERKDLDRFFGDIKTEIIRPLEEEKCIEIMDNVLFIEEDVPEEFFNDLVERDETVDLDIQEKFNYQLLWYQVEFLQASNIFNGIPAFISLLSGTVDIKQRYDVEDKVYVCKFTHPVELGNDYTYGVLVEAAGNTGLSDYSGWVMFYDCCGDYSGFAGSEHMLAEQVIEEHLERDKIKLREMELDKESFQELVSTKAIGDRGIQLSKRLDLESERNHLKQRIRRARGLVVELVSYYYLSRKGYSQDEFDWNIYFESGEMDIRVEDSHAIRLIECKYDPANQDWDHEIQKLTDKLEEIDTDGKTTKGEFWFWVSPSQETIARLEEHSFDHMEISEIITQAPEFKGKNLDHLKFVMKKIDEGNEEPQPNMFEL